MRHPKITSTVSRLLHTQPFYAVLLLDLLKIVETDTIPTAATDGKSLFINTEWFVNSLKNDGERLFVLAHEVLHVVYRHCPRLAAYQSRGFGPDLKPFSGQKWNRATDYIINYTLHEDKVGKLPAQALYHPDYTSQMIADELYLELDDDSDEDSIDEHMAGSGDDAEATDEDVKNAVANAAQAQKAKGDLPDGIARIVGEVLEPKISWKEQLRTTVLNSAGRDDLTWAKPNRRKLVMPGIYMPGTTGRRAGHVIVSVDTSGSISEGELQAFMSEIACIVQDTNPELMQVGSFDTAAYGPYDICSVDELMDWKPEGGGGTDLPVVYQDLNTKGIRPDVLVFLTDGYTGWGAEPNYPVVVVSTTSHQAPYGTNIRLELDE
tara:strand:- start:4772 stop:5905 length:1134 start_codon:yes stop_codon:yes gene_type:complete